MRLLRTARRKLLEIEEPSGQNEQDSTHQPNKNMKKEVREMGEAAEITQLAEDAKTLLAATAQVAEQKVVEARKRVMNALSDGWDTLADKTMAGCRVTDETIREHPYKSVGVALGLGALIGYLFARR